MSTKLHNYQLGYFAEKYSRISPTGNGGQGTTPMSLDPQSDLEELVAVAALRRLFLTTPPAPNRVEIVPATVYSWVVVQPGIMSNLALNAGYDSDETTSVLDMVEYRKRMELPHDGYDSDATMVVTDMAAQKIRMEDV